jgi:hypothetical protein
MSTDSPTESRVVIALDAGERGDYAVELARLLVPTEAREMLGLFVENQSLLEYAGSRQAREVLLTGSQRALSRSTIERQIRADAARARALFEAASARLGLPHRFETARGDILLEPVRRSAGAQALVVSLAESWVLGASQRDFCRQLFETGPPLVVLARPGWFSGRSVAVIVSDGDDSLLDAAARIARHTNSPLIAMLPAGTKEERERSAAGIADKLRERGIEKFELVSLGSQTIENVLKTTRAFNARLLVMHSPATPQESASVEQLLRRFSGALMFVRT